MLRDESRRVEGLVRQGRRLLFVEPLDDGAALVRVAVLGRDRVFEQFERERAAQVVGYVVLLPTYGLDMRRSAMVSPCG